LFRKYGSASWTRRAACSCSSCRRSSDRSTRPPRRGLRARDEHRPDPRHRPLADARDVRSPAGACTWSTCSSLPPRREPEGELW